MKPNQDITGMTEREVLKLLLRDFKPFDNVTLPNWAAAQIVGMKSMSAGLRCLAYETIHGNPAAISKRDLLPSTLDKWKRPAVWVLALSAASLTLWLNGVWVAAAIYCPVYIFTAGYLINESVQSGDSQRGDGFIAGIIAFGWPIFWAVWLKEKVNEQAAI